MKLSINFALRRRSAWICLVAFWALQASAQAQTGSGVHASLANDAVAQAALSGPTPEAAKAPTATSRVEALRKSEEADWHNISRVASPDERVAFLRTYPSSDKAERVSEALVRGYQVDYNTRIAVLESPEWVERLMGAGVLIHFLTKEGMEAALVLTQLQQAHFQRFGKLVNVEGLGNDLKGLRVTDSVLSSRLTGAVLPPQPYKLGYSWRMRQTDLLASKATEYTRTVTAFLPALYTELNHGAAVLDAQGNIRSLHTAQGKRRFDANFRYYPSSLVAGAEHTFGYTNTDLAEGGAEGAKGDTLRQYQRGSNARMKVVGLENVTVPAGTFEVWRVERSADWQNLDLKRNPIAGDHQGGKFALTGWDEPSLRRYIKTEERVTNHVGKVIRHEVQELLRTD